MTALEKLDAIKNLSGGSITGVSMQMTLVVSNRTVTLPDWFNQQIAQRLLPELPGMLRGIGNSLNIQAVAELDAQIVLAQNNLAALRQKREKLEDPASVVGRGNSQRPEV